MKIKKSQIEEAILGAGEQPQTPTMSPEDIRRGIEGAKELEKAYGELGSSIPFFSEVSENTFDRNYGRDEDIEYQADLQQQMELIKQEIMKQQDDFLNSPKGIEYMQNILKNRANQPEDNPTDDLPFESVKNNRKVLKTIKLKNLK